MNKIETRFKTEVESHLTVIALSDQNPFYATGGDLEEDILRGLNMPVRFIHAVSKEVARRNINPNSDEGRKEIIKEALRVGSARNWRSSWLLK